jgi:hypothetical protein
MSDILIKQQHFGNLYGYMSIAYFFIGIVISKKIKKCLIFSLFENSRSECIHAPIFAYPLGVTGVKTFKRFPNFYFVMLFRILQLS